MLGELTELEGDKEIERSKVEGLLDWKHPVHLLLRHLPELRMNPTTQVLPGNRRTSRSLACTYRRFGLASVFGVGAQGQGVTIGETLQKKVHRVMIMALVQGIITGVVT